MTADSADLLLMGLLSVADALLDLPIERVLATLPVSDDLRFALSRKESRFSDVYNTVLSYEHGDWKQLSATLAGRIDNADTRLPGCYMGLRNALIRLRHDLRLRQLFIALPCQHDHQARGLFDVHRGVVDQHGVRGAH
jgi:c-di-GMP-related signal transduction protein